jgi:DNA topoisomerase II
VKTIISKDLMMSNRKKADIVEELPQKKFRPFPKAKAAGETEESDGEANDEAEAEEASSGTSTDYDNLLAIVIWSLTKEKVRRHQGTCLSLHSCSHFSFWLADREAPSASGR